MVTRKKTKVKGKTSKKKAQRKKIIRLSATKKRPNSGIRKPTKKKIAAKKTAKKKAAKKRPIAAKKKAVKKRPIAAKKKTVKAAKKKPIAVKKKRASRALGAEATGRGHRPLTLAQQRAIKGWKTRNKKRRKKAKRQREARIRQLRAYPDIKGVARAYQKEIRRLEREAERERKRADIEIQSAYERGQIAERERAALELSESEKRRLFLEKQFVESDQSTILARLWLAADYGELEQEIDVVAEEFDMNISEVYDLYYSPEAQ